MQSGRTFEVIQDPTLEQQFEQDIEDKFRAWQTAFTNPESPGKVTVYEVPLDAQGRAQHSAGGQIRLGAWPADAYNFDDLCTIIIRDYMDPKKELMGVRFIGTRQGEQGVRFNSVTILRRPRADNSLIPTTTPKNEFSEMIQTMQESNERMMRLFQSMMQPREEKGTAPNQMQQFMQFAAMQQAMMQPMLQMMTAVMGRAAPVSIESPMSTMKGLLEGLTLLDGLRGERSGGGDSTGTIVKAVADVASPLLQMAATQMQRSPAKAPSRPPLLNPGRPAPPAAAPPPARPVAADPVILPMDTPSRPQVSPFAPGPDLSAPSNVATFPSSQEKPVNFLEIKARIDRMIDAAKIGTDPISVAQDFWNDEMMNMESSEYNQLCTKLEEENFVQQIALLNPEVNQFIPFFTTIRERLLKLIQEEDDAAASEME